MMNPEFPGQYGQGPTPGYGPPRPQGPPGQGMYNGQPIGGPPGGGHPKQFPTQNGPQPGYNMPGQGYGPQGDMQFGAPRPGMIPNRGPPPPGQPGLPGPNTSTNQLTNQMGGLNMGNQPPRSNAPGPMGGNPSYNQQPPGPRSQMPGQPGINQLPPRKPPQNMGMRPPSSMAPPNSVPNSIGPPSSVPNSMGPPSGVPNSMGPPTSMGPPQTKMGPPPMGMGPPSSSYNQPNTSPNIQQPMYQPPTSIFPQQPPVSQFNQPPTSNFGGPPTSNFGQPPTSNSFNQPPTGNYNQPPTGNYGPKPPGMGPPTSMGGGMPPPPNNQYGMAPPPGMDMRPPSTQFQGPPHAPGPNSPGYGPPPGQGFPPTDPAGGYQQGGQQFNQGYGGPQPARPGMQPAPAMQPPQQRRLDPDQMPSPIQVMDDDIRNRSGLFSTAGKGTVPPLVTTPFITQDQGNSNPAFIRSSMYNVPCTSDMLKNSHIPFSLTISPFATLQSEENIPPIVNLGELGPVRCKRCKAYMNPHMMFIDGGRRFQCVYCGAATDGELGPVRCKRCKAYMNPHMMFIDGGRRFQCVYCGAATDVPNEYFAHLDHTGRRVDSYDRPELCLGSYEYVATKDYCKNGVLPKAPAFIFMIDVSYNSIKSGLVDLICARLKNDVLVNLPKDTGAEESEIRVGFVTYSKEIHFYNVKGALAQPQMLVVSDVDDMFVPLLDGFLVTLAESEAVIDSLLSQIPTMFSESRETEVVLGPVIQAGLDALKSADRAGKLYIFHTSLPIGEAPGKLKNRDDRKLLGTDKEKSILTAQSKFYSTLAQECVSAGCSVDMFLFPNSYCDVATISDICRLTSGNMYKYSYFQADLDGDRFMEDFKNNIQSQRAFDAIVRVRTNTGIRPVDFLGNFYMSNTTDVEMCAIDSNQAISVEIKHDDKLNESEGAYVQVAVLFTSVSGQRRLRIHNLALNCCTQLADLFRNCELDTAINFMSKYALRNILNKNPRETREHIMNQVANILACYRKNCASPSSSMGQLILPECLKLLPLYGNCVIKSDGVQGGQEISTDDRSYLMHLINSMDVKSSAAFFYPRLLPLHDLDPKSSEMPSAIRCSAERLEEDGVYLLENGVSMFLWIGHNTDPEWIQNVFAVQSAAQIDIDKSSLLDLENETSHCVREVIRKVRSSRNRYMKLTIVRQRDKLEPWFSHFLVEDKGSNGSASYVDFLCHIHKEIRNLLN